MFHRWLNLLTSHYCHRKGFYPGEWCENLQTHHDCCDEIQRFRDEQLERILCTVSTSLNPTLFSRKIVSRIWLDKPVLSFVKSIAIHSKTDLMFKWRMAVTNFSKSLNWSLSECYSHHQSMIERLKMWYTWISKLPEQFVKTTVLLNEKSNTVSSCLQKVKCVWRPVFCTLV